MASDITLYWGSGSPFAMRAMMSLEEKGLSGYTSKQITFDKNEHKSDEYLKLNPRGQVPTFKHGDVIVNESLAICLYLERTFKGQGTTLIPDEAGQQALVLQRAVESDNIQSKAFVNMVYYFFTTKAEDRDEALLEVKAKAVREELQIWEGYLAKQGDGSYIAGKAFTLADITVFPFLATLVRMGLRLEGRFPQLASYHEKLKERPSVKASWPPHWKGTTGPGWLNVV